MNRDKSIKELIRDSNGEAVTQLRFAKEGIITQEMKFAAERESQEPDFVRSEIAQGRMCLPANVKHPENLPCVIGRKALTKVNSNIGASAIVSNTSEELAKLATSIKYGADTVMDLSTGPDITEIREAILRNSTVPIGTVPIYEAIERVKDPLKLSPELILEICEEQAEQGVDYFTVHSCILLHMMPMIEKRVTKIVSRGGSLIAHWMISHHRENPFYTHFDKLLDICRKYDITLSLGDALRPGCIHDASDEAQFAELAVHGELNRRAQERDVQVMIEGPGHVPMDQIRMNMEKERELCNDAPFYVLGPLTCDLGAGYDHITAAIGGAMAAYYGAAMLCYVTPKEHLGLPNEQDVRTGLIATRIAAHSADVAHRKPGTWKRNLELSRARYNFDWETVFALALDGDRAREMHDQTLPDVQFKTAEFCSMCGPQFCAMKISREISDWNSEAVETGIVQDR